MSATAAWLHNEVQLLCADIARSSTNSEQNWMSHVGGAVWAHITTMGSVVNGPQFSQLPLVTNRNFRMRQSKPINNSHSCSLVSVSIMQGMSNVCTPTRTSVGGALASRDRRTSTSLRAAEPWPIRAEKYGRIHVGKAAGKSAPEPPSGKFLWTESATEALLDLLWDAKIGRQ